MRMKPALQFIAPKAQGRDRPRPYSVKPKALELNHMPRGGRAWWQSVAKSLLPQRAEHLPEPDDRAEHHQRARDQRHEHVAVVEGRIVQLAGGAQP